MFDAGPLFIHEDFNAECVSPAEYDELLANAWRHLGTHFFRYNIAFYDIDVRTVIPLRIRLSNFSLSKSQRRVLRRNGDVQTIIRPIRITPEIEALFERHKTRFTSSVPESIYDFLSRRPADSPVPGMELCVYRGGELMAVSFFGIGENCVSGTYAAFEPSERTRSLGIFTMLKEIEFAAGAGKDLYYQGYSYEGNSYYDYKKRFRGTEAYDWAAGWVRPECIP